MADELPPELRKLLSRARELDMPGDADRARVLGKLKLAVPLLGVAVPIATEGAAAASMAKGASNLLAVVANKVLVGGVVLAVAGGVTYQAVREPERRSLPSAPDLAHPRAQVGSKALGATAGEVSPTANAERPTAPRTSTSAASSSREIATNVDRTSPSAPSGRMVTLTASADAEAKKGLGQELGPKLGPSLPSEVELLAEAQRALSSGDPGGALALARDHERRFARSGLLTERLAVEILAYCGLKRPSEAEARMKQFVRMAPSSPLRPRLEASCARSPSRSDSPTIPALTGH